MKALVLYFQLIRAYLIMAIGLLFCLMALFSCKGLKKPEEKVIVEVPRDMDAEVKKLIHSIIDYSGSVEGKVDDSTLLSKTSLLNTLYEQKNYSPLWSSVQNWKPQADSLLQFIENARLNGLFPSDYHSHQLIRIKNLFNADRWKEKETRDAAIWARADLMLSDALVKIIQDVKLGHLPNDSITLRKDSALSDDYITGIFNSIVSGASLDSVIAGLEPKHTGYLLLKAALRNFLDSADFSKKSTIVYPNKDAAALRLAIVNRLRELGFVDSLIINPDSTQLSGILKKYQKSSNLTVDGRIGTQTVRSLNLTDQEKFNRIVITMDRYKMLAPEMPKKYIWVNIPSYKLKLVSGDTVLVSSRIVVGKPITRTPVLTSSISEMITYPQWNIPQSIIEKEILPGLKKDTAYLRKKGYMLLNYKNEEVNPDSINWAKYTKTIPYKVIQGSGDDNALGVLKFNFANKYSVYLHDTNQRFYFGLDTRALSHGCVRVQEWQKMAFLLLDYEEMPDYVTINKDGPHLEDSLVHWLAVKEKHSIRLHNKIPLFIRYFTCEATDGHIVFFEDIYNEDKQIAETFLASKWADE